MSTFNFILLISPQKDFIWNCNFNREFPRQQRGKEYPCENTMVSEVWEHFVQTKLLTRLASSVIFDIYVDVHIYRYNQVCASNNTTTKSPFYK